MAKYLKLFNTHTNYTSYINNVVPIPNVSYCEDNNEVHYNPFDYSRQYLRTTALESGTISFNIHSYTDTNYITSISYSTDNGETWVTTPNEDGREELLSITVNVSQGDAILWKGIANQLGDYDEWVGSFFSSTARFNVDGNIMSLCYGDNFIGQTTLIYDCQFLYLFSDYNEELPTLLVSAENLYLPATTLTEYCYDEMFQCCYTLVTAPKLPATTLAPWCYDYMFEGCTSLTTAPVLPATTLADNCYNQMFNSCSSLNSITCLATNISASGCTFSWVNGVASSGTFTKAASTSWTTGVNGIPSGWTVQDA